ncbi:integration host factor, actinobacterial type [Streptomyces sp. NPDC055607]
MPIPVLSAEDRAEALRKAVSVRRERSAVLAALKNGTTSLESVLERDDAVVGRILVRRLLESLPGIGKNRAAQLLSGVGISERRRVRGLGVHQRERLLELFPSRR